MKKLFVLSFTSMLLLTGCGATETLSCTYKADADNGTTEVKYDIDHEGNEIKKVRITYNYDFDNTNTDNNTTAGNANGNNDTNTGAGNNTRVAGDNMTGTVDNTDTNTDTAITDDTTNNANDTTTNNNMTGTTGRNNNNTTNNNATTNNNSNNQMDGVGTGTDGTTNDTQQDDDGVVDGVVGSAIDTIVGTVTSIILDSAGLRDRHANVQNTYGNVNGFSVQNTSDTNNKYSVTYVIDYDTISDNDLASFNLVRDLDDMKNTYVNQGFTCK